MTKRTIDPNTAFGKALLKGESASLAAILADAAAQDAEDLSKKPSEPTAIEIGFAEDGWNGFHAVLGDAAAADAEALEQFGNFTVEAGKIEDVTSLTHGQDKQLHIPAAKPPRFDM